MRCLKESYDELWICSAQAGVPRSAFVHLKAGPLLVSVPVSYDPSQEVFGSEYELISLRKRINHVASNPYFACCIRHCWHGVYCDDFNSRLRISKRRWRWRLSWCSRAPWSILRATLRIVSLPAGLPGFSGGYGGLGDRRAYHRSGAGVGCLAGSNAPGLRGHTGWKLSFSTRHERCLGLVGVIFVDFGMYAACPRRFS